MNNKYRVVIHLNIENILSVPTLPPGVAAFSEMPGEGSWSGSRLDFKK